MKRVGNLLAGLTAVLLLAAALASCTIGTSTVTSEGTITSPIAIGTAPETSSGRGANATNSYYSVTITPNTYHDITISGLSEDLDLYVYDDPSFTSLHLNGSGSGGQTGISDKTGTTSQTVTNAFNNHNLGELYIEVIPHTGVESSDFTITVS